METKGVEMEEASTSGTSKSLHLKKENELKKSSESKSNTKSLLEGICSDFQNIEVLSPKDKTPKASGLPGTSKANESSTPSSKITTGPSTSKENSISNHVNNDSNSQSFKAATNVQTEMQQSSLPKAIDSNAILSSSLAQVADAEIIQTADNQVSIVITNPRMIQVLKSEDGKHQYSALPQAVESIAESVVVEEAPDLAFQSEISAVAKDIVYDGHLTEAVPKKRKYQYSAITKGKQYSPISKGKTKAPVYKPKTDISKMRARRISAKMKAEWARLLAKKGSLVCPLQGCYQKYVTIANFVTHYKYCVGQTELKHCPYCSSLIFSDSKSMLHHMEVEHPDRVKEFKATLSDDEGSSHYDEEEEVQETPSQTEKRKLSFISKENQSPKGRKNTIFKSIARETEIENIKEFQKCVRFDDIVSKINSCDEVDTPNTSQRSLNSTYSKSPKERKRKVIVTGFVEEEKYFEDADEFLSQESKPQDDNFKLNTKSRLVLDLERYKQFNQHLKLTRDWSTTRKTYSRPRMSDSSLDSSFTSVQTVADCPKDDHQLDDLCLKVEKVEDDEELYYVGSPNELSVYDLQDPKAIHKTRPSLISEENSERKRVGILKEKIENKSQSESLIVAQPSVILPPSPEKLPEVKTTSPEKILNGIVLKEKKVPCYLRDAIAATSTPQSTPEVRKPVSKAGPIITYGKKVPVPEDAIKKEKLPVVDFDTLFKNSMKEMKLLREKTETLIKNSGEHLKENGIKQPVPVKRKRGRPRKNPIPAEQEHTSVATKEDGVKMVNGEQKNEPGQLDSKTKNLKNSQARAYIKSKRQKSIKNLNSRRVYQSHILANKDQGLENKDQQSLDNTTDKPVDSANIDTNATATEPLCVHSAQMETGLDKNLPNHGSQGEEVSAKITVPQSTEAVVLNSSTQPVKRRRGRPKKIVSNENLHLSVVSADNSQSEISQLKTVPSDAEQAEVQQADKQPEITNASGPSEVTETDLPSEVVSAEQSEIKETGEHSEIPQNTAEVKETDLLPEAVQNHSEQSSAVKEIPQQSDAENADTEQPGAVQTAAEQPGTVQTAANQLEAVQVDVEQSKAMDTDSGYSEALKEGAQSEVVQTSALQSDTEQKNDLKSTNSLPNDTKSDEGHILTSAVKSNETQSESVQSGAVQNVTIQSDTDNSVSAPLISTCPDGQSDLVVSDTKKESEAPLRKSLRNRSKSSTHSNTAFVFPTIKKEPTIKNTEQTPPGQPRRPGRPRKYPPKVDLNASVDNKAVQKGNLNSQPGDLSQNEEMNSTIDEQSLQNYLNTSVGKQMDESMQSVTDQENQDSDQAPPQKKKGRPRKIVQTTPVQTEPAPVKRRGRPRKSLPQTPVVPSTQQNSSEASVLEDTASQTALRKSRKGRPVKCVHYEALNSLATTRGVIQEKAVASSDSKNLEATEAVATENNKNTADPSQCPKPEKFILPPKKRKISGEDENVNLSKEESKDPDYFDSEDMSESDSEVEYTKKSKRRSEELEDYIPEKKYKKKKKKFGSHKISTASPMKPNYEFLSNFTGSVYEEKELYLNIKPLHCMFAILNDEELKEYMPPVESISMKLGTTNGNSWTKLNCFESLSDDASKYITFFAGGPISAAAFCPTPHNKISNQYIALSTHYSFLNINYASIKSHKGLIQIYNLGNLQDMSCPPVLELALCHKHAVVTDMKWCPRGCYQEPVSSNRHLSALPRLGLLAVASSDSYVRIFAIPHPQYLTALVHKRYSLPFMKFSPSVVLEPMCGSTRPAIATSVTWANTPDCEQIAVGYGNGMIGVWLINTTHSILLTDDTPMVKTIIPYMVFQAHGTPITSLQFAPLQNCRFLVSSGFDKTLKFFDLMDTSIPFCSAKRGCAINCQWSSSLCGAFVSLHDGITFKGSNYYKDAGTEEFPTQTISGSISSLTKSCVSDAVSVLATADMKGSVSVKFVAKQALCGSDPGKLPPLHTYKLFKTEIVSFENVSENDVKDFISHIKDVVDIADGLTTQIEDESNTFQVSNVVDQLLTAAVENTNSLHVSEVMEDLLTTSVCNSNALLQAEQSVDQTSSKENFASQCSEEESEILANIVDKLVETTSEGVNNLETSETAMEKDVSKIKKDSDNEVAETLQSHSKLEINSSDVNICVNKQDSETTGASKDISTTNNQENKVEENSVVLEPVEGEEELDSKTVSEMEELFDDDSFSSEGFDSDKESDIASDEELNFSDDSMMSECSLSSKSSESSYLSDNPMDESVDDSIQTVEPTCNLNPQDSSLTSESVESKFITTSSDLPDSQNSEPISSATSNHSPLIDLCIQDSEPNHTITSVDSTKDCVNASEQEKSSISSDSTLTNDNESSQPIQSTNNTLPSDSTSMEVDDCKISSIGLEVGISDGEEVVVSNTLPADSTDNVEILTEDKSDPTADVCSPMETDSVAESALTSEDATKHLEPSIHQFYKQQTRTSKPYLQPCKPVNETSVNNVEKANNIEDEMVDADGKACNNPLSYEEIVSSHGIAFKDFHLGKAAESSLTNEEEGEKLPGLEQNNISSVNTIIWNPNHGCEYWLFSAGNSGIARLCCVSEINVPERLTRRKQT
ncbi:hypothetical protein JTE90_011109 [Oedothorax gibbosus]|uniref:General transcription factor 3C polypeptide 2 n=1 Tax=Oedothorax gibbosus TaxID=931172 RepID=A0AAV6UF51_9ARAC|nr:hypothetical protein JTE90_011109 [Oedothorax gibbosus]